MVCKTYFYKMKTVTFIFLLIVSLTAHQSDAQQSVAKDALSISKSIGIGEQANFGDYSVVFDKVLTDSRCPKNTVCVRAGEAEILVAIYKKDIFLKNQKLSIDASGFVLESTNLAFSSNDFKIYGFGLTPYPINLDAIKNNDYVLELVFQPTVK
jgi:hypothetical protein